MEAAKSFQDLIVWQKAHEFVLKVYQYTKTFPKEEVYGLTAQFRRAAISIAANIAERFKKRGALDKIRFLNISQGSLEECRYFLVLGGDLGYGENTELRILAEEISRLLETYRSAIFKSTNYPKNH